MPGDGFGRGCEAGLAGLQAEADEYLRAKFAGAPRARKPRRGPRPHAAAGAAPERGRDPPEQPEVLDADERELLGLPPLAAPEAAALPAPSGQGHVGRLRRVPSQGAGARADELEPEIGLPQSEPLFVSVEPEALSSGATKAISESPTAIEEMVLDPPPDQTPLEACAGALDAASAPGPAMALGVGVAVASAARLAEPGSEQATSRCCPEGHAMVCYIVALSSAFCDECELMQNRGEVVFGCKVCDCELCSECVLETAASPEQARADQEVLERVSSRRKPLEAPIGQAFDAASVASASAAPVAAAAGARFVATPSGALLDAAPEAPLAAAARAPGPPGAGCGEGGASAAPRCSAGGCCMPWERHARHFGFHCRCCGALRRGARWHCAEHGEDVCGACGPAGQERQSDLDEGAQQRARRGAGGAVQPEAPGRPSTAVRDVLGELLAEQELLIARASLDLRECREAHESARPAPAGRPAAAAPAAGAPAAGAPAAAARGAARAPAGPDAAAGSHPGAAERLGVGLMDEDAARRRPQWAAAGAAPDAPGDGAGPPLRRTMQLTLALVGDFVEELARGYAQDWFQALVRQCAADCASDRAAFVARLQRVAYEVQKPILENWGFDEGRQGLYDMTCIFRDHCGEGAPAWLRARVRHCLALLYGAPEGEPAGECARGPS